MYIRKGLIFALKFFTMLYLILSIICSVAVGVIFKAARQYSICTTQVIAWNYVFALLLCFLFFEPDTGTVSRAAPWALYVPLMFLLPVVFLTLAASVKHMGIVKTDAAQRLSLFIPILAAWFIFKEDFSALKVMGLIVGFPAIFLILYKRADKTGNKWIFPTVVLIGFGVIDLLFKQLALYKALPYTTSLFIVFFGALVVTVTVMMYQIVIMKIKFNLINLAFGTLVGIFNFGNILFYLKAHKAFAQNPSTVFAAMNMGVIMLGCIIGTLLFKEKLTKYNFIGLFLALAVIVLITLSQIHT